MDKTDNISFLKQYMGDSYDAKKSFEWNRDYFFNNMHKSPKKSGSQEGPKKTIQKQTAARKSVTDAQTLFFQKERPKLIGKFKSEKQLQAELKKRWNEKNSEKDASDKVATQPPVSPFAHMNEELTDEEAKDLGLIKIGVDNGVFIYRRVSTPVEKTKSDSVKTEVKTEEKTNVEKKHDDDDDDDDDEMVDVDAAEYSVLAEYMYNTHKLPAVKILCIDAGVAVSGSKKKLIAKYMEAVKKYADAKEEKDDEEQDDEEQDDEDDEEEDDEDDDDE